MSDNSASPADTSAPPEELTLAARDLSRHFGTTPAVAGIDLELRRGEVLGLLGPNGAGKTTTMQMLTGNLAPTTGSISVCGIDLLERPTAAKARIGYLPEVPPLYKELKVDEYLRLAARLHRVPRSETAAALERAKRRCGVSDIGHRLIGTLSKGYQQRVGIAQAVIHSPDLVILDEPTVGLDPNQIREIRALIRELSDSHSVILSTHILPEVEAVCDRVQILHRGRIVYNDRIAALQRFRGVHSLLVGFRRAPSVDEISRLPGVAGVEPAPEGLLRILRAGAPAASEGAGPGQAPDPTGAPGPSDAADLIDALVHLSVQRNWALTHLSIERASLEDVFVHLTGQEAPEAAAIAGAAATAEATA
jgi:ABC-2 type transport system ATP-binding protein